MPETAVLRPNKGCQQVVDFAEFLQQRGYSESDVAKILGGNFLRVFEQVWK